MRYRYEYRCGPWDIDLAYRISIWSSLISIWDMANDMGDDNIDTAISHMNTSMGYLVTLARAPPSTRSEGSLRTE